MQGYELVCLKIPSVSPLGLVGFLIGQDYFYPLYYYRVGPRVPLEHLWAVSRAIVVAYI